MEYSKPSTILNFVILLHLFDKKCIIKTFAGKVLFKGKEQKLEERRQAGADMKRNPGYAIDQPIAAVNYQLNLNVVAKGIWAYFSVFRTR